MNIVRKRIEKIMYSEGESIPFLQGFLLLVLSFLYGIPVKAREVLYRKKIFKQKRLPCKVISIGNITVGGTGKTPMTVYLAEMLAGLGRKIVVISRGYRGRAEKNGGVVSNGREILMGPDESGDEPFMMAAMLNNIPVRVGQNRYNAGLLAIRNFNPDIILLDDGFQHRKLFRDIDLLLLDSRRPFGNSRLLPRVVLREPAVSIKRSDAFILTRTSSDKAQTRNRKNTESKTQPFFESINTIYL
ncbi:MAG: tetraacyldisaccharide 4-kinase, partial [Thermodesulfobacteriota bacterium]|nr:tetraacyldisaccharide 4-kinase [Thermodesulfobacteriota bacterium]